MLKYARPGRALSERPEDIALDFYFQIWVLPGDSTFSRRGWSEYIAPMFANSAKQSVLRMSTMAMAGALLVAWLDRRPDNPLSRAYYLRAVSIMKDKVAQQDVSNDEVLMSVLLLQMYEVGLPSKKTAASIDNPR